MQGTTRTGTSCRVSARGLAEPLIRRCRCWRAPSHGASSLERPRKISRTAAAPLPVGAANRFASGVVIQEELVRRRTQALFGDLDVALVGDVGLDQVAGEDVALEQEGVVVLQR